MGKELNLKERQNEIFSIAPVGYVYGAVCVM